MMMVRPRHLLLALLLFCAAAQAEGGGQSVRQDGFEVHYAAINTTAIAPATARALGVRRSGSRAVLVLNAQRLDDDGATPVRASAEVRAANLIGQTKAMTPRVVEDAGVWYVLADFGVFDAELLRFEISVLPDGAPRPIALRFEQTFYREP